jgi:hypothetical protein
LSDADQLARQRDEELVNDEGAALRAHFDENNLNLHTCLPGHIVSFDSATQTAKVQPGIQRIFAQQGPVNLPELVDVPVCFPGGHDWFLTFPVANGDECLLMFSERAIDFWWQNGGVQLPAEYRTHDLSDAFAFVGVNSKPHALTSLRTDGPEIRTRDGSHRLALSGGYSFIGTSQSSMAASLAELPVITQGVTMAEAIDTLTELPRFVLGGTSMHTVVKP